MGYQRKTSGNTYHYHDHCRDICPYVYISILWMLSTSFKYEIDVMEFPVHLIPQRWNFQNYVTVFTKSDFPGYYLNSHKSNFHYDH